VKLAIGQVVVYGPYGIGRVIDRKQMTVSGVAQDVVVLDLTDGLTVTLPVERAQEQLRPVASELDIGQAQEALRMDGELSVDPWLSRRRGTLAKLSAGRLVGLAEIVNDGARREQALVKAGAKRRQLSPGEREIFVKAWQLLAEEIARARGLEPDEADGWIEEQLRVAA
jgi:RNA polymerase-interacting CarD/CdnL/TRCF family regulator